MSKKGNVVVVVIVVVVVVAILRYLGLCREAKSKANLGVKILFGNITHLIVSTMRKMLEDLKGTKIPSWPLIYLLLKLKFILKVTMGLNLNFRVE